MTKLITETTDILFESIKDTLAIIDQNRLDQVNVSILFEKLNKIIITSTLLSRFASRIEVEIDPERNILDIKLRILSVLKMIANSTKCNNYSLTHDLITLELRDSLVKWIIQIIPSMRQGLVDYQYGLTQSSAQDLISTN